MMRYFHSVSPMFMINKKFLSLCTLTVFVMVSILSCKSTVTGPTVYKTPDGRSGAGIFSYRPVPGAVFQLKDIRYNKDSVGIITGYDSLTVFYMIKDTGVTFSSGLHGMMLLNWLSNKPLDTSIVQYIIDDSELARVNLRQDTIKRSWLRSPVVAGASFASQSGGVISDMHIDSTNIMVATGALSSTAAIRITQSSASSFFGAQIGDTNVTYLVPDYFLVKIHAVRTFIYPGSKPTYSMEDAELTTKPY